MTERRLRSASHPPRDRWSFADDIAPQLRRAPVETPPAPPQPTKRDFLLAPPDDTTRPGEPATPIPLPPRESSRPNLAPPPSYWARIDVPEADRARAAAAGVERYMEDAAPRPHRPRPASWLAVAAILLIAAIAAVALYRFADPLTGPQRPTAPPVGFEPVAPPPNQSSPARDAPLIEVAP